MEVWVGRVMGLAKPNDDPYEARKAKKEFILKIEKIFSKIKSDIELGKKPFDDLAWLEGLLSQTIDRKKYDEYSFEDRHHFIEVLRMFNLIRAEMKLGHQVGFLPDEDEEYFMEKSSRKKKFFNGSHYG